MGDDHLKFAEFNDFTVLYEKQNTAYQPNLNSAAWNEPRMFTL
jgi:hypothetical protein